MVQGYNRILVVVDQFSKYVFFVATKMPCSMEEVVKLFFNHIVKYWSLPLKIVSNRDARFISKFWTTLFNLVTKNLLNILAYHLKTDGHTE
jgi:antitoxin component of RelBE/YafQ-DinJ toxin-antitoxin module